jgi:sulfite dehydrogenase (quinone) subunit SoeC
MHPAYSVIVFTTASGAGYGLLIWLAFGALTSDLATQPGLGWIGLGLALALIAIGLLSSTLHLGRPERAWRAFSQWRTSWLSREALLAMATFIPAGGLALLWVFVGGQPRSAVSLLALATIALALATVWCTGMIYQSLPTIRAWHMPMVSPIYVALALASGAVLYHALIGGVAAGASRTGLVAIVLLLAAAILKLEYWRSIDGAERTWTAGAATGLGRFGTVRVLEQPHTQANYVMREMGFSVARRHAQKLRRLAVLAGFGLPMLLIGLSLVVGGPAALICSVAAVLVMAVGLVTERWLFFAEAQHVVSVFYGAAKA